MESLANRFLKGLAPAALALSALPLSAGVITIANFDEDLATVYVNNVATTNGQQIAVDGEVTIELRDFRSDYYFRFAPETQTDRTLAFESWEGLPVGYENATPAIFTPVSDITVTPNVDVKGYCWNVEGSIASSEIHQWAITKNDTLRSVVFKGCKNAVWEHANDLVLDLVRRVKVNGRNYTVTAIDNRPAFDNSHVGTISVAPRFEKFGMCITDIKSSGSFNITNLIGIADTKKMYYGQYCFYYGAGNLQGRVEDFVSRNTTAVDGFAFARRTGMRGVLNLDIVTSIGNNAFQSCSGLTAANLYSPNLKTIGTTALSAGIKDVLIGSTNLTSVATTAFSSAVTNFTFLAGPPTVLQLDNLVSPFANVDGAHSMKLSVDPAISNWWHLAAEPTDREKAAGLPPNFMGVYVTSANARKGWMVASRPMNDILLVGLSSEVGNQNHAVYSGLSENSTLELIAPAGMNMYNLQHFVNGEWTTFASGTGIYHNYIHDGQLTRLQWRMNANSVTTANRAFAGSVEVELIRGTQVAEGYYATGTDLRVTAIPSDVHPKTKFVRWVSGAPEGRETDPVIEVSVDGDLQLVAEFGPAEWVYDETTKKITDGHWTSAARSGEIVDYGMTFSCTFTSSDPSIWLDLSIPIYVPSDPDNKYWITGITGGRDLTYHRVRFGENITSLRGSMLWSDYNIDEVEGLGKVRETNLGDYFLYMYGTVVPLMSRTYEAEDFVPPMLTTLSPHTFGGGPKLKGKLVFGAMTNVNNIGKMNIGAVTNIQFLAEGLSAFPDSTFRSLPNLTTVTIGSTNLVRANYSVFENSKSLKDIYFLAHAPSAAVLDNLLYPCTTTNTVIHASKWAPGWKGMRAEGYTSFPEWENRPEGCWGMYKTANGKKRFYLVHCDSKYGPRPGLMILVK